MSLSIVHEENLFSVFFHVRGSEMCGPAGDRRAQDEKAKLKTALSSVTGLRTEFKVKNIAM